MYIPRPEAGSEGIAHFTFPFPLETKTLFVLVTVMQRVSVAWISVFILWVVAPRYPGLGLEDNRLVNQTFAEPQCVHSFSIICPDFSVPSHSLKGFMILKYFQ